MKWSGVSWVLFGFMILGCVHELPLPDFPDDIEPPLPKECNADTVYFQQAVLPLVTSLCGKSGCHGTTNPEEFQLIFLSATTTYNSIKNLFVSSSNPTSYTKLTNALTEMAGKDVSGYVPPTTTQLNTLKKWISQGAENNYCTSCDSTQFTYSATIGPLLSTYCVSCHTGSSAGGGVDLSTIAKVQTELTNHPGRLLGSIEWTPPYTGSLAMPLGGSKLPACNITQVRKWIDAGAPNN